MGRPSAPIIMANETMRVLEAPHGHVVCYRGKPISVRYERTVPVYVKTIFPHSGHAKRLADKLNAMFGTDKFTVRRMKVID